MKNAITVSELPTFLKAARKLLDETDLALLVEYLAYNPTAGDLIEGTGGIRKLRWRRPGMGKRGGLRVIYYFHDPDLPLYLITAYPKSQKEDLSGEEKAQLREIARLLVRQRRSLH